MNWFFIALISALLSAAAAIAQKKALFKMDAAEFSFILAVFNFVLSIPFFFSLNISELSSAGVTVLFVKSVIGVLAFLCVMLAIKNLEISGALPLMALTPAFVALFAFIFLGEVITGLEMAGMSLLLIGTYILDVDKEQKFFIPFRILFKSKYYHYIFFALLLFTASSILDKVLLVRMKISPFAIVGIQHLFFFIIFLAIFVLKNKKPLQYLKSIDSKMYMWIVMISVITIGYRYTQILAIKTAPVALVLSVKRISVFIAAVAGGKIFKEKRLFVKAVAAAIMIAGAVLIFRD